MWIHTFAPEPVSLKKPIPILVRPHDGEYLASLSDANINISGETAVEAFTSIKSLILDIWERLQKLSTTTRLGPKLEERLAVLREYIDGPDVNSPLSYVRGHGGGIGLQAGGGES